MTCNAGGPADAERAFMGGSGVWAPLLGYVGGFEGEEVGVRVVDMDEGVLGVSTGQEARGAAERKGRGQRADPQPARELYKIREDADKRCG